MRERAPNKVLHQFYSKLEKHKQNGDSLSLKIEKKLRIIARMELLASFLEGKNPNKDCSSVKAFLDQVRNAKEMRLDR
nr:diacylglycerol kinase 5-like isoform X1 [Ipomoea batatas]GMC71247.1 diacylglycerol kinase 5-like isoform X1 [Ipomoea batatas]